MSFTITPSDFNVGTHSMAFDDQDNVGFFDREPAKINPIAANMLLDGVLKISDRSPTHLYSAKDAKTITDGNARTGQAVTSGKRERSDWARAFIVNIWAFWAWEEEVEANYKNRLSALEGFEPSLRESWDTLNGNPTDRQKIFDKYRRDRALLLALRDRFEDQTAITLEAALKDIEATETGSLKESAAAVLARLATGEDEGIFPLSKMIGLASKSTLEVGFAELLMTSVDNLAFAPSSRFEVFIYVAVGELCPDQRLRDKALDRLRDLSPLSPALR